MSSLCIHTFLSNRKSTLNNRLIKGLFFILFFTSTVSFSKNLHVTDKLEFTSSSDDTTALEWFQLGADIDGFGEAGRAVSMPDNNTIATGSPSGNGEGRIRIYDFIDSVWTQRGEDILAEQIDGGAGRAICMPDDNTVAIGAPFNDNSNGEDAGQVRVFQWIDNSWQQQGNSINGEAVGDFFGFALSMSDANTLAVGAPLHDNIKGHAKVFDWDGNNWIQRGLTLDGEDFNDQSGTSVSMPNANTLAVGALANDNENGNDAGHARIYDWINDKWIQRGDDINGEAESDFSGSRVSMPNANTIAISASNNDANGNDAGQVRVFVWENSRWTQFGEDIDGENSSDRFGFSLSMPDPFTLGIGIRDSRNDNGFLAGRAQVYIWNGTSWVQKGDNIDGEAAGDRSGFSVHMPDANTISIGALFNDNNNGDVAGQVRVYSFCEEEQITGVEQVGFSINQSNIIDIFPNPSSGKFQISSKDSYRIEKLMIYNLRGEIIKEINTPLDNLSVDLSNEIETTYLMKIITDTGISSSYLLLQK